MRGRSGSRGGLLREEEHQLDAVVHVQGAVDGLGVVVDGVAAAADLLSDLRLGQAGQEELEHASLGVAHAGHQVGATRGDLLAGVLETARGVVSTHQFRGHSALHRSHCLILYKRHPSLRKDCPVPPPGHLTESFPPNRCPFRAVPFAMAKIGRAHV